MRPSPVNRWLTDSSNNEIIVNNVSKPPKNNVVLNDPKCGSRPTSNRRVISGSDAGFGTFPWQALVKVGKAKCGGVLGKVVNGKCLFVSKQLYWTKLQDISKKIAYNAYMN